jgi:hypothetical protein
MLSELADRTIATLFVELEPQLKFIRTLQTAAEEVRERLNAPHWSVTNHNYVIRDPANGWLIGMNVNRIVIQTLASSVWFDMPDQLCSTLGAAIEKVEVKAVKRVALKFQVYVPLKMTHPEIVDLIFGSYMLDRSVFKSICGEVKDAIVQLHGERHGLRNSVQLTPQTAEEAVAGYLNNPNLEHFLEKRYVDPRVGDFQKRIEEDVLLFDAEVWQKDPAPATIPGFLKGAVGGCEHLCTSATKHLQGLK